MRLSTLPRSAQFFLLAVVAAGTTALVAALQTRPTEPLALAALAGFAIIFSTWQVELVVLNTVLTLGSAVVCLAMLLDGPTAAVLCAAIGALVGTLARIEPGRWLPRMRPGETLRVVFNVANCVLATGAAAAAHQATVQAVQPGAGIGDGAPLPGLPTQVAAITVFQTVHFLVNSFGVTFLLSLLRRQPVGRTWSENFLWTWPSYYVSASAAILIYFLYRQTPIGSSAVLFLAPLYFIYYSYRLYVDRMNLYPGLCTSLE